MEFITKMFVKAENWRKGQTMTEYALILATIAAISIALVQSAGTIISELVGQVRPLL